jgi:hypothetical protein
MPYYLVTHTSLIESEDEVKAAHKVLAKLKSDASVEFAVKFDEENMRQVTVSNTLASEIVSPTADDPEPDSEAMAVESVDCKPPILDQVKTPHSSQWHLRARGIVFGVSLFAAGLSIGLVVDLLN